MRQTTTRKTAPKLDQSKLLGFRNLPGVTTSDKDIGTNSEVAFNKIGTDTGEGAA